MRSTRLFCYSDILSRLFSFLQVFEKFDFEVVILACLTVHGISSTVMRDSNGKFINIYL